MRSIKGRTGREYLNLATAVMAFGAAALQATTPLLGAFMAHHHGAAILMGLGA